MANTRDIISYTAVGVVLFVALVTALGAVLGSPMGVSYVKTDSMKPTLHPDDGFILVPDELTPPPEKGDIVVFRAEELGGGGLTTHRVVGKTDRGYITQGDNNNSPDQAGDEPPVQRAQIVGQPLQIGDQVVLLPQIGRAVTATADVTNTARRWFDTALFWVGIRDPSPTQLSFILTGLFVVLYALESFREGNRESKKSKRKRRRVTRRNEDQYSSHTILVGLTGLLVLATTAPMVLPSGQSQYGAIASKSDSPVFVTPGEDHEFTHSIGNTPILPMVVFIEGGDGVSVTRAKVELQRGEIANVSATISVPRSVGYHRFYLVERWYIPVLPETILIALFQIHPWLPIAVIDLIIATPYYLIGRYTLLRSPGRSRSRSRDRYP